MSLGHRANLPHVLRAATMSARDSATTPPGRATRPARAACRAGKTCPKPNGSTRVEQHDIEIAGQPAMLETVVQQDHLALEFLDGRVAAATRSGFCKCGTSGSFCSSSKASSFGAPLLGAVAAADQA